MIQATIQYPGHAAEQRDIEAIPKIGDTIDGPEDEAILWKVAAVFHNSVTGEAEVTCKAEAAPQIVGDASACSLTS